MSKKDRFQWLKDLVDPLGPVGEFLSPSEVYKTRPGLPITASKNMRAEPTPIAFAEIEKTLAPARFVAAGDIEVPYSRERQVSPYVTERYRPVYAKTQSDDPAEILRASQQLLGWTVTQEPRSPFCDCRSALFSRDGGEFVHRKCGRRRAPLSDREVVERAMSAQLQPSDSMYDTFYPTIPGKDSAVIEGVPVTGGTRLRSRKEWREKTKGWVLWDKGVPAAREKADQDEKSKREAKVARVVEKCAQRLVSDHPGDL